MSKTPEGIVLEKCKYCGKGSYKDSVPCDNEEEVNQCKIINDILNKIWQPQNQ